MTIEGEDAAGKSARGQGSKVTQWFQVVSYRNDPEFVGGAK